MSSTPLTETANQLTEQIERARHLAARARRARQIELLYRCRAIGAQLDAARVQLLHSGPRMLDAAAAFVGAGAAQLARIVAELDRCDLGVDRLASDRVDAADVIAWIEHHGIRLSPRQRRAIEQHLPA